MNIDSLLNKPYGDRQFIVVVDDPEDAKENREWWKNVADGFEKVSDAMGGLRAAAGMGGLLAKYLSEKAAERIREAHNLNIPVLPVPASITSELKLLPGHPRSELLYVAHPSNPLAYLPFASFHRLVFESKFAEVMTLLPHLGATSINVKHVRGWEKDFTGNLSGEVPQGDVEVESEGSSETSRELLYNAELPGHDDPSLPDDQIWYPHEPTWQSVAKSRMDFNLVDFDLKLQYTDNFEVTAGIAADARAADFSLGGSFEEHQETVWKIEGTFGN